MKKMRICVIKGCGGKNEGLLFPQIELSLCKYHQELLIEQIKKDLESLQEFQEVENV